MLSTLHPRRKRRPGGDPATIPLRDKVKIAALAAAFVGFLTYTGILFADRSRQSPHFTQAQSILAGLPADPADANMAFRARILTDFPLSTPEETMVETLSRRGFVSDGWFAKRMTFRWLLGGGARGPCDFTASVTWDADDQKRIRTLDARLLRTPGCADWTW